MNKLLLIFMLSLNVLAATSGTIMLKGYISQKVKITVTSTANATNLDLEANATNLKVADVKEESNTAGGYVILMSSSNAGRLVNTTDSNYYVPYTIDYGSASGITLTTTDQAVKTVSSGGVYNEDEEVFINFNSVNALSSLSGEYKDLITITIQIN